MPYTVFALLDKDSPHQGQVALQGSLNGKAMEFCVDVTPWTTSRTDCRILHALAAKHVIRDLEESLKSRGDVRSRDKVLSLSLQYEVASSRASFVAVEEREEATEGILTTVRVPLCPIEVAPVDDHDQLFGNQLLTRGIPPSSWWHYGSTYLFIL